MKLINSHDANKLLLEIDKKRKKMILTAMYAGLSNEETIKCSQELDVLLNQYNKIKINQNENTRLPHISLTSKLLYFISYFSKQKLKNIING